jgi:hypothetical protein
LQTNSAAAPVRRDAIPVLPYTAPSIDEYLHRRLMPVEGVIPHLPGIEMAKEICHAFLEYAVRKDEHLQRTGEQDRIDDKTVFIIKRN